MKVVWLMLLGIIVQLAIPTQGAAAADRPSTSDCHYVEDRHLEYIHELEQKLYRGESIGSAQDVRPKNLMHQVLQLLRDSYPQQDHQAQCQQLQHLFSPQFQLTLQPGNTISRGVLDACATWLAYHASQDQSGTMQTMVVQEWPMLVVHQQLAQGASSIMLVTMENLEEPRITQVKEYKLNM
jgi:hypothetical protein